MTTESPIEPTVGRIVLYRTPNHVLLHDAPERPAIVTKVHSRNCIDIEAFGCGGLIRTSVIYQDGVPGDGLTGWRWMPYQVAKAAEAAQ